MFVIMKLYEVTFNNGYETKTMYVKARNMSQCEAYVKNYSSYFELLDIKYLTNNIEDAATEN